MRTLFHMPSNWPHELTTPSNGTLTVAQIDLASVAAAHRRDLVFRIYQDPEDQTYPDMFNIAAFGSETTAKSVEDALAEECPVPVPGPGGDAILARVRVDPPTEAMEWQTLSDVGTLEPDLTGLRIRFKGVLGETERWDDLFIYTTDLAYCTLVMIEAILLEYTEEGCALERFDVFNLRRGRKDTITPGDRAIMVSSDEDEWLDSADTARERIDVHFTISAGVLAAEDQGREAYDTAKGIGGAIRSILHDERRTLDGFAWDTIIGSVGEPEEIEGRSGVYLVCEVTGKAQVLASMISGS